MLYIYIIIVCDSDRADGKNKNFIIIGTYLLLDDCTEYNIISIFYTIYSIKYYFHCYSCVN